MNKQQIIVQLQENHQSFTNMILSLKEKEFLFTTDDKWTAGQQAEHIFRSVKPVKLAFTLPLFILGINFGKANRPSRSYENLLRKYKDTLAAGHFRRGAYPVIAIRHARLLPYRTARHRDVDLGHGRNARPDHGPDHWRLADRNL